MNRNHRALVCFLVLLLLLLPSAAQAVVQLIPPVQEVSAQRGRTTTFTITVRNIGDEDVPCTFEAFDMDISEEGLPYISEEGWQRGAGDWITLTVTDTVLPAHGSFELTGDVAIPRDAEGGYYAIVRGDFAGGMIPLEDPKNKLRDSGLQLQSQAMVVVMFNVQSRRSRPQIYPDTLIVHPRGETDAAVVMRDGAAQGWHAVLPVKNDGDIHTQVTGSISFWTEGGLKLESAQLESGRGYVLPDRIRNLEAYGAQPLNDGYYMVRITLQTGEGRSISNSYPFAIYEGEVYPGALTEELSGLIRAASPGFRFGKPLIQQRISPGGASYVVVKLSSSIDDSLVLTADLIDWKLDEGGAPVLTREAGTWPRSCAEWIEMVDEEVVLAPGRNSTFKLRVHAPQDASGDYFTGLVFNRKGVEEGEAMEFTAPRTQLIAVTSPKGRTEEVKVDTVLVEEYDYNNTPYHRFRFVVDNVGNGLVFAKGNVSLERKMAEGVFKPWGRKTEFGYRDAYVLPAGGRRFEVYFPVLDPGEYRAIVAVQFSEDEQPLVKYQRITIR